MNDIDIMKEVGERVAHYSKLRATNAGSTLLAEVKLQYVDMANGGDGGDLGFTDENGNSTCRSINYPRHPDRFFKNVCHLMGWTAL